MSKNSNIKKVHITTSKVMAKVQTQYKPKQVYEQDKKELITHRNKKISDIKKIMQYYNQYNAFKNVSDEKFYNMCVCDPEFRQYTHCGQYDNIIKARSRNVAACIVSESHIIEPARVMDLMRDYSKNNNNMHISIYNIYGYIVDLCNNHNEAIKKEIIRIQEIKKQLLDELITEFNTDTKEDLINQLLMYPTPQEIFISCYRTKSKTLTCRVMLYVSYLIQEGVCITANHIENALSFDVCNSEAPTILYLCKRNANLFWEVLQTLTTIWNSEISNVCALIATYACW